MDYRATSFELLSLERGERWAVLKKMSPSDFFALADKLDALAAEASRIAAYLEWLQQNPTDHAGASKYAGKRLGKIRVAQGYNPSKEYRLNLGANEPQ